MCELGEPAYIAIFIYIRSEMHMVWAMPLQLSDSYFSRSSIGSFGELCHNGKIILQEETICSMSEAKGTRAGDRKLYLTAYLIGFHTFALPYNPEVPNIDILLFFRNWLLFEF